MRTIAVAIGLYSLFAAMPAEATVKVFDVTVSGTVTGVTTTIACNSGSPDTCLATYPGGNITTPFVQAFSNNFGPIGLEEGLNHLSFGFIYAAGFYDLFVNRSGDFLTGTSVTYDYESAGVRFGQVGAFGTHASATSFAVAGGVPEPSTWAMMLLGFGAMGICLRRRKVGDRYSRSV